MTLAKIQSKLVAAQNCHPNAVQALIAEALDAIDEVARAEVPAGVQPAAILPAFIGTPKRKLDELLARGFQVNGLQIERDVDGAEPVRGFITVGGLVGWWSPDTQAENLRLREQVQALKKVADSLPWYDFGTRPAVPNPITEEMHQAAVRVLTRANGLDGTPQRMLDAMIAAAPQAERCTSCDGTGDVVDQIGEWRGYCICEAGQALKNQKGGA